jgi:hypothetical protein
VIGLTHESAHLVTGRVPPLRTSDAPEESQAPGELAAAALLGKDRVRFIGRYFS